MESNPRGTELYCLHAKVPGWKPTGKRALGPRTPGPLSQEVCLLPLNTRNEEPLTGQLPRGIITFLFPSGQVFQIALRQRPMEAVSWKLGKFPEICC